MSHTRQPNLSPAEAQLLMSQLLDGELAPADAARLETYLELNPDAADWLESSDLSRQAVFDQPIPYVDADAAASAVLAALPQQANATGGGGKTLRFPVLFRYLSAAAALAVAGLVGYQFSEPETPETFGKFASRPAVVESVDTDIPNASPVVYTDAESGWTVVWVAQFDPVPGDQG